MDSQATSSTADTSASAPAAARAAVTVPAWVAIIAFIVGGTGLHLYLHYATHGIFNLTHAAIAFFLVLNILINFWELGLMFTSDQIAAEYEATKERYAGNPLARVNQIFLKPIPVTKLFSFKEWTAIWSGYALFDPGYADRGSFGFNIDVCNGFSTIIPATLFGLGMTYEILPARILGILGIAMFWQMLYGTIVYFFQFFNAGRHHGHSPRNIAMFVGGSNGLWFVMPILGLWASVELIMTDSFAVFGL